MAKMKPILLFGKFTGSEGEERGKNAKTKTNLSDSSLRTEKVDFFALLRSLAMTGIHDSRFQRYDYLRSGNTSMIPQK